MCHPIAASSEVSGVSGESMAIDAAERGTRAVSPKRSSAARPPVRRKTTSAKACAFREIANEARASDQLSQVARGDGGVFRQM
jgi:hypothetical protein